MNESSLSRPNEFASIVSTLLNIQQDVASLQYVARHQNVGNLIILCYISLGLSRERNVVHQSNSVEAAVVTAVPLASPDCQNAPPSVSATATMAESSEILLQIILLKVIGDNGRTITTYGLVDSGSDVTMINPSLIEQLEIQGEASQLFLSTVNQ